MQSPDNSDKNMEKEFKKIIEEMTREFMEKNKTPEFNPKDTRDFCIHDAEGNIVFKQTTSSGPKDLFEIEKIYEERNNRTYMERGNFDRLHIFSKDLQRRACINVEYTYVVDIGNGPVRFKSDDSMLRYLALSGIY